MALDPDLAALRLAVRRCLSDVSGETVLVACSGGADSLALLAATVFEARRAGWHVIGVTVDHGLQEGSAARAQAVVEQMAALGADETMSVQVTVDAPGLGPEAAAREARYAALGEAARAMGSAVVLLGHTLDDQAETVLLGLTRGSGARSLSGMRAGYEVYRRPLLGIRRAQTEAACRADGISFWHDPHNDDRRFTRSRVRQVVLPMLEDELGPGIAATLARTAQQLREDNEALDRYAHEAFGEVATYDGVDVNALLSRPDAVVSRVLRLAALDAGALQAELFAVHVNALVALARGAGRGEVQLPGHVTAFRTEDHLRFRPTSVAG